MVDNKYAIAYSEILEILKHIPMEDYNKIPKEKLELFEANANNDYTFNYDPNKTLQEQNVSKITQGIIILLFRDYWATEIQRNKIIAKQNYDRMKLEEKKKKKYNPDNLFKSSKKCEEKLEGTTQMIEYKESIFQKIVNKIRLFLKIK